MRARERGVRLMLSIPVAAAYDDVVLLAARDELLRARPARVAAATGVHEGAAAYEGADRPGVIDARVASVRVVRMNSPPRQPRVDENPFIRVRIAACERREGLTISIG